ncbi:hypothetical protein GOV09_01920 [Candidatus Woesearchaeota archaeon]|nr:hypothetical protein [Candidatus Woesearchaeota archaeon]
MAKKGKAKTEKHLENLLKGIKVSLDSDAFKEAYSDHKKIVDAAVKEKYGKTNISGEIKDHYVDAMAHLVIGTDVIKQAYDRAGKEIGKKVEASKKGIAQYVRDLAKKTGDWHHYSGEKSDAALVSRVKEAFERSGHDFEEYFKAFQKDKTNDEILDMIKETLASDHTRQYHNSVLMDYTLELDDEQSLEFAAAYGSHMKSMNISDNVRHAQLATNKNKLHGEMAGYVSGLEQLASRSTAPHARRKGKAHK